MTGSVAALPDTTSPPSRGGRLTEWAGMLLLAMVLGQASLYGREAPFAFGLLVLVWERRREDFPAALVGAALGTWLVEGAMAAGATVLLALGIPMLGRFRVSAVLGPVVGAVGGGFLFWIVRPIAGPGLLLVAFALVLGALTVVMGQRAFSWLDAAETGRDANALVVAGYCLAAVVAGTEAVHWGWWSPGITLGTAVVLVAATVAGPAGGALAGAALGLTLEFHGGVAASWVGGLVVAGFLSGVAARQHWRLSGLGFGLGLFLYAVLLNQNAFIASDPAWSMGLAALVFAVLPGAGYDVLRAWGVRLAGPDPSTVVRQRVSRMAAVLEYLARIFALGDVEEGPGAHPVQQVVGEACQHCSLYRQCWEQDFYRSYRGVQDLLLRAEDVRVGPVHLDGYLVAHCIKPERLAEAANRVVARSRQDVRYRQQLRDARQMARRQLQGMAQLLAEMAQDDVVTRSRPDARRRLRFTVGVAQRPRGGGQVSGDTPLVQELEHGRVAVGLSDGMGVGPEAAFQSGTAVELLGTMLKAGFSETMALETVNTVLLLRSPDERFATLDLVLLDLCRGEAELVKVAAAPTFLRRGALVEVIRSESLPMGILRDVKVQPMYHKVEAGDVLVMVSDGVLGPPDLGGEERFKRCLRDMPMAPAGQMAETLLAFMLDQVGDARDDALVMVVRIEGLRPPGTLSIGERVVGEWRRLTPQSGRSGRDVRFPAGRAPA